MSLGYVGRMAVFDQVEQGGESLRAGGAGERAPGTSWTRGVRVSRGTGSAVCSPGWDSPLPPGVPSTSTPFSFPPSALLRELEAVSSPDSPISISASVRGAIRFSSSPSVSMGLPSPPSLRARAL